MNQNRFGLRFASPGTEATYQSWRNEQNVPQFRLLALVSIAGWLFVPPLGNLWHPDGDWFRAFLPVFLFALPSMALALLATHTRWRRHTTVLVGLSLCINGGSSLWAQTAGLADHLLGVGHVDPGSAVAGTIFIATMALVSRLPPLLALASITPFMGACFALLLHEFQAGLLSNVFMFVYAAWLNSAWFMVAMMSVISERFLRQAFINETLLTRSRNLIRRYVPPALVERIIDGRSDGIEAPQRRRITMLFSDIVGFTDMADRVEPEVMTQVISEYMATMTQVVDANQGTVNEFIGDGLMALFGAPQALEPEAHARFAVQAAQAMQAKLPELNARWRKLGLGAALQIRVGINTGMVSVGSYGSEGRMTYTAIGLQTNIAARIQSHCEPGGVLMSDATWQLVNESIACSSRGEVQCKGVHYPVAVYEPVAA